MAENRVDIEAGLARKLRLIAVGVAMPQDRDARKALFDKAASAIDELRAAREEIERMKEALEDIVEIRGHHADAANWTLEQHRLTYENANQIARAALKGTP